MRGGLGPVVERGMYMYIYMYVYEYIYMYVYVYIYIYTSLYECNYKMYRGSWHAVERGRLLKIVGLFFKRALLKRLHSEIETCDVRYIFMCACV